MSALEEILLCVGVIGLIVYVGMLTYAIGKANAENALELSAIKAGVGEYYLDASHQRQFRWKKTT